MLAALIVVSVLLLISYLFIGLIVGWLAKDYLKSKGYVYPELFDENGNILPDEILAVRFENSYDDDYTEEDYTEEDDSNS
jgi:hypothetical protein